MAGAIASAEQKLFGGPVSITGAISETAAGAHDKSLKAGLKRPGEKALCVGA